MLPRERVFAALEHCEPDRIPWGEHSIDYMDIVFVSEVPPKGYQPQPMERLDDETYRDTNGDLYRVSATTHDLMPYRRNTAAYVPPTLASLQEQIDRLDEEPVGDANDSCWELVHHAVKEMKDTHFILLLCGDVAFPGFGAWDPRIRWLWTPNGRTSWR